VTVIAAQIIPDHLPARLAICMWGFYWLTYIHPDEPYGDLERAVAEAKDRRFNCLRIDVAPDWCYDLHRRPRGAIELKPFLPGATFNSRCFSFKGGVRCDVHDRILRLFDLAEKYDMYLGVTTWQYQETTPILADHEIRRQILSVPPHEQFMHLAQGHDRLINELKHRRLEKRIAYVEIHNEMNYFPGTEDEKRLRAEAAIDFLRQRHGDLLITADYAWIDPNGLARNTQLIDHHVYAGASTAGKLFSSAHWDLDKGPDLNDETLRWLLKPNPTPWKQFLATVDIDAFPHPAWICRMWFYANLDNQRFDYWCFRQFGAEADGVKDALVDKIRHAATIALERSLPAVLDEGYNLYPPLGSRFEESAAGRWFTENAVHAAIEEGYWGITPTGYFAPDEPAWREEPQKTYMIELNDHILNGKVDRLLGPNVK